MPYVDSSALKERVSIEAAAQLLGLDIKAAGAQYRTSCPICKSGGDRAIVITPAKSLFYCFPAQKGGDTIGLVAHCLDITQQAAALYLDDQIGTVPVPDRDSTVPLAKTAPPKPPGQLQPPPAASKAPPSVSPRHSAGVPFDPDSYASKLVYNDQVAALGLSEADAARLQIGFASTGFHRGRVAIPLRDATGQILGFIGWDGTSLKFPRDLLPSKVVQLHQKRA